MEMFPEYRETTGVARQLCARRRAMKLAPLPQVYFFQICKFSF